jgi:hypothetical protein
MHSIRLSPTGLEGRRAHSDSALQRPRRGSVIGGVTLKVAWIPGGNLRQSEWAAVGRRFGTVSRCSQWWIGDWIRYGVSEWGEKYAEAARITGYDPGTLRNMAWVASQFDLSLRNDKLSWSHHALLAPLSVEEKMSWLDWAARERLSVADLRGELRGRRTRSERERGSVRSRDQGLQVDPPGSASVTCPHCGHSVELPGAEAGDGE